MGTRFRRSVFALAIALTVSAVAVRTASAADTSTDEAHDVAIATDGKIVAVGGFGFAVARYTRDGRPDLSFGTGGKVLTFGETTAEAQAVALQPDGKIVVFGDKDALAFTIVRYTRDGRLDPTFGRGGEVAADPNSAGLECVEGLYPHDLAIQPDGRIVAVGECSGERDASIVVTRYTRDGHLDPGFGNGGWVSTSFGPDEYVGLALVIQPDGKIVVAGTNGLVRYDADGHLDATFGRDGKVRSRAGGGSAVVLQRDGGILVAGDGVMRYTRDGVVDPTFGDGGRIGGTEGAAVAVGLDGTVIACCIERPTYDGLVRLTASGADGSFGTAGTARVPPFDVSSLALRKNGTIVAAGSFYKKTFSDFAIAQFTAAGRLDRAFGRGGLVLTDFSALAAAAERAMTATLPGRSTGSRSASTPPPTRSPATSGSRTSGRTWTSFGLVPFIVAGTLLLIVGLAAIYSSRQRQARRRPRWG